VQYRHTLDGRPDREVQRQHLLKDGRILAPVVAEIQGPIHTGRIGVDRDYGTHFQAGLRIGQRQGTPALGGVNGLILHPAFPSAHQTGRVPAAIDKGERQMRIGNDRSLRLTDRRCQVVSLWIQYSERGRVSGCGL
jgi:hypothetical protein